MSAIHNIMFVRHAVNGLSEYKSQYVPQEMIKSENFKRKFEKSSLMMKPSHGLRAHDDSYISTKWQSEYDSKCRELRQQMDNLKSLATAGSESAGGLTAGKPTGARHDRPINFVWNETSPKQSPAASVSFGDSEYRDRYANIKTEKPKLVSFKPPSCTCICRQFTVQLLDWVVVYIYDGDVIMS